MKALLLTLGLVVVSALVAVARWGLGEVPQIDGVIAAPQLGELASPRRKETERPLLVEDRTSIDVAQAITEGDPEETPAESTRRALTESDVAVLEQSFEARHYDATKEELREVYDLVMERIP